MAKLVLALATVNAPEGIEFLVELDGKQIGRGLVKTSMSYNDAELFIYYGDWQPGGHDVTLTLPDSNGFKMLIVRQINYNGKDFIKGSTVMMTERFVQRVR